MAAGSAAGTGTGLPKVAFIGTGGTISSLGRDALDILDYTATDRRLEAGGILEVVPELATVATMVPVPFRAVPSPAIGFSEWRDLVLLCERLAAVDDSPESISVRVYPALIRREHPLASVHGANNAVFVEAEAAGNLMFYGAGAGGVQTASAVLGDVVAVARHRVVGGHGPGESAYADLPVLAIGQAVTRYHISLDVADRPGVLAQVATVFAEHGVSIETVRQRAVGEDGQARAMLIVVTHAAPDAALTATVEDLGQLETVNDVTSVMRVEGESE